MIFSLMIKVFFIGDSTLRGLMFAFLLGINGSLTNWEASHEELYFRSYGGHFYRKEVSNEASEVVVGFSYFPVFWEHRRRITLSEILGNSLSRYVISL